MATIFQMQSLETQVRREIVRMVYEIQFGHPGSSLGFADSITTLYASIIEQNPANFTMESYAEDLFFLANSYIQETKCTLVRTSNARKTFIRSRSFFRHIGIRS